VRHGDKQIHTQAKRAGLEYIVADGPLAEEQSIGRSSPGRP